MTDSEEKHEARPLNWFILLLLLDAFTYLWRATVIVLLFALLRPECLSFQDSLWKLRALPFFLFAIVVAMARILSRRIRRPLVKLDSEAIRQTFNLMTIALLIDAVVTLAVYHKWI